MRVSFVCLKYPLAFVNNQVLHPSCTVPLHSTTIQFLHSFEYIVVSTFIVKKKAVRQMGIPKQQYVSVMSVKRRVPKKANKGKEKRQENEKGRQGK